MWFISCRENSWKNHQHSLMGDFMRQWTTMKISQWTVSSGINICDVWPRILASWDLPPALKGLLRRCFSGITSIRMIWPKHWGCGLHRKHRTNRLIGMWHKNVYTTIISGSFVFLTREVDGNGMMTQNEEFRISFSWLVVWLPFFILRYIGNLIIPIDELHHFSEGWPNHQPVSDLLKPPIKFGAWIPTGAIHCRNII